MLYLYEDTQLKPEQNARYENLDKYLSMGIVSAAFPDFQFIKPALETYIKIEVQDWMKRKAWDYCKVVNDDGGVYYYFVTRHKWVSQSCIGLTLAMDTINTFWDDIHLTDKTHITRRLKDRFKIKHLGSSTSLVPIVDKFAEDISNPPMRRTSITPLGDRHLWYLVQRTDYGANDVKDNPVSTYLLKDEGLEFTNTPIVVDKDSISQDRTYLLESSSNERIITLHTSSGGSIRYAISFTSTWKVAYFYYSKKNSCINVKAIKRSDNVEQWVNNVTSIEFTKVDHVFRQRSDFDPLDNYPSEMNQNFDYDDILYYYSSAESSTTPSFDDWYKANKTDTNLVKITCLPYCPVNLSALVINKDYQITNYGVRLTNPNIAYKSSVTTDTITIPSFDKNVAKPRMAYDLVYEPKRYNSNYHTVKYVYDNNVLAFNLEDFTGLQTGSDNSEIVTISFHYNKEMSNSLAFQFDCNYNYSTDYGEWLVCNKSLDVPYFTNEYLNYLRYGKAVDEKNMNYSIAGTVLSGLGTGLSSTVGTIAGASVASLAVPGLGIATGILSAGALAVSVASSVTKARDAINAKIDAYTHQASRVNGSSDLSIFKAYGDNKLLRAEYDPDDEFLTPILNYFRLYGYATDEYGVPNLNTRYYSDFAVFEPDFASTSIDTDYLDDIKARCQAGLRVFHYHHGYDILMSYENWETGLISL